MFVLIIVIGKTIVILKRRIGINQIIRLFLREGVIYARMIKKIVHHSVYAEEERREGSLRSREFVVYDKGQTYPEYIIYYQRNFSNDIQ